MHKQFAETLQLILPNSFHKDDGINTSTDQIDHEEGQFRRFTAPYRHLERSFDGNHRS